MIELLTCKEVTKLISDSMETTLPLGTRIGLRLHLMICKFCSRYKKQLSAIKKIAGNFLIMMDDNEIFSGTSLSPEAKKRIKSAISDK